MELAVIVDHREYTGRKRLLHFGTCWKRKTVAATSLSLAKQKNLPSWQEEKGYLVITRKLLLLEISPLPHQKFAAAEDSRVLGGCQARENTNACMKSELKVSQNPKMMTKEDLVMFDWIQNWTDLSLDILTSLILHWPGPLYPIPVSHLNCTGMVGVLGVSVLHWWEF